MSNFWILYLGSLVFSFVTRIVLPIFGILFNQFVYIYYSLESLYTPLPLYMHLSICLSLLVLIELSY